MFQILLLLVSLLLQKQASLAAPLVKGNCPQTCGGVAIPFPFGIGTGCFLDEWYEIVCQDSSDGTILILNKTNLRVFNISLPDDQGGTNGMISVSLPIIFSSNVSCGGNRSFAPVSLKGSQFIFSESRNVFAAVGCNICALLDDTKSAIIGCQSKCKKQHNIFSKMNCSGRDGCCHTTITSDLQAFSVTFRPDKQAAENKCEYAFLGDMSQFTPSTTDFTELESRGHFPAVLEWGIANSSQAAPEIYKYGFIADDSYNCSTVSFNLGYRKVMPFLQCSCRLGFTGNPYIKHGCKDVDECEDPNRCHGKKCVNRRGSYDCVEGSKTIKFILVGIGAGLGALFLLLLLWLLYNFMKKRKEIKLKERHFKENGGLLLQQQLCSFETNVDKNKLFNFKDLERATDNFNKNRILGQGAQGTIYKGMLADGGIVAIKKSKAIDKRKVEQFINEIAILSQINHRNVVKLLGCCLETESPLLVYEFIPNGTLFQYLRDSLVSWDTRLRIATEVAGALSYLHSSASIPIYHRDIKSINILLDDKYRAKVADFGTSKSLSLYQTHVTTAVQGTFGYLDPEYFQSCQFTDKSDVYSFGVVLVELLTGRKPVSLLGDEDQRNLASYFLLSMDDNCLFDIVDDQVLKEGKKEGIVAFANLARRCLNLHGKMRPTMKEVASELERIRKLENPAMKHDHTPKKRETSISWDSAGSADIITMSDVQPLMYSDSM
ncbi:wall-associated receptor kinase-like 1 [Syzygium oleosum]|uniref:wall-associated receptor kinase-like 1 n=1 Tax=Syzygium oleosum TaxID=219896 RepID=UPI0024B9AE80|nr:wall-associated receptor kinase-like 1 [Syzygium oleosum]